MIIEKYPNLKNFLINVYLDSLNNDKKVGEKTDKWSKFEDISLKFVTYYNYFQSENKYQSRISLMLDFNYNKKLSLIKDIFKKESFVNCNDFKNGLIRFKQETSDPNIYRKLRISIFCDNSFQHQKEILKNRYSGSVSLISRNLNNQDSNKHVIMHGSFDLDNQFVEKISKELDLNFLYNPLNVLLSQINGTNLTYNDLKPYLENVLNNKSESYLKDFKELFLLNYDIDLKTHNDFKINDFYLPFKQKNNQFKNGI